MISRRNLLASIGGAILAPASLSPIILADASPKPPIVVNTKRYLITRCAVWSGRPGMVVLKGRNKLILSKYVPFANTVVHSDLIYEVPTFDEEDLRCLKLFSRLPHIPCMMELSFIVEPETTSMDFNSLIYSKTTTMFLTSPSKV